jgi:hypothetical protein
MSGGEISDNIATGEVSAITPRGGGGIYLHIASTLYLSGSAKITRNSAHYGGGIHAFGGIIHMSGGEIGGEGDSDYNYADVQGGGVNVQSGGLYMSGGKITGNRSPLGGGVRNQAGQVQMSGGEIKQNIALYGGGVSTYFTSFAMSGGASINGNIAAWGGGVCLNGGDFTLSEDASISSNDAWYLDGQTLYPTNNGNRGGGYGGGVYLYGGSFTKDGGFVTDNAATYDSDYKGDQICTTEINTQHNYIYRDADITDTETCMIKQNDDRTWTSSPASGFWAVHTTGGNE